MADEKTEKKAFRVFQEGRVRARFAGNVLTKSSGGYGQMNLRFEVLRSAVEGQPCPDAGQFITDFVVLGGDLTEKQQRMRFGKLITVGWDKTEEGLSRPFPDGEFILELENRVMPAKGEYAEKTVTEVKYINSLTGGPVREELPAEQKKAVAGAIFAAYGKPAAPKVAEDKAGAALTNKDKASIPF